MIKKLFYIILCFLLIAVSAQATDYYIDDTSGNDGNAGTSTGTAWKTIAKINDFAEATGFGNGDTINFKRGETWDGSDEPLGWDTAAINWGTIDGLTIQSYGTGDLPRIDANDIAGPIYFDGNDTVSDLVIKDLDLSGMDAINNKGLSHLEVFDVDGLEIDNIYIDCHDGAVTYGRGGIAVILVNRIDGNITITDNTVKNAMHDTWANTLTAYSSDLVTDWNALSVRYSDAPYKTSGTVTISGNTFTDVFGDCIHTININTTTNIFNNFLGNPGEDCLDSKGSGYFNVYNNYCHNIGYYRGRNSGENHAFLAHQAEGADDPHDYNIYNNYIYKTEYGVRFKEGMDTGTIHHNKMQSVINGVLLASAWDVDIYYNIIINDADSHDAGEITYPFNMYFSSYSTMDNIKIYNNVIYRTDTDADDVIRFAGTVGQTGNEVKNNIFWLNEANAVDCIEANGGSSEPTITHNICYNSSNGRRYDIESEQVYTSSDEATWISAGHTGGIFTTPGLESTTELWPASESSDAVGNGYDLGESYDDLIDPDSTTFTTTPPVVAIEQQPENWIIGAYGLGDSVSVTLAWDANSESDIGGYKLYYGTASEDYDYSIDVGNVTTYEVTGLDYGTTYFFAVTAYFSDVEGVTNDDCVAIDDPHDCCIDEDEGHCDYAESDYSDEAMYPVYGNAKGVVFLGVRIN